MYPNKSNNIKLTPRVATILTILVFLLVLSLNGSTLPLPARNCLPNSRMPKGKESPSRPFIEALPLTM